MTTDTPQGTHTPGPWRLAVDLRPLQQRITDEHMRMIADVFIDAATPEDVANARLIAAAPDLFAAAKAAVHAIDDGRHPLDRMEKATLGALRDAIDAATRTA